MTSKLYKVLPLAVALLMFSAPALAQDGGADFKGGVGLGAGLAMGLAVLGSGLGRRL